MWSSLSALGESYVLEFKSLLTTMYFAAIILVTKKLQSPTIHDVAFDNKNSDFKRI